jgi:hypothetical protein
MLSRLACKKEGVITDIGQETLMTSWSESKIPFRSVNDGLDSLKESIPGTHCLMVYPDLMTLRGIYSHYTKMQLEDNNEMVLILPYYETADMVRLALSGKDFNCDGNNPFGYSGIDESKYEKEGSLMIKDSFEVYFPPEEQGSFRNNNDLFEGRMGLMTFIDILLKHSKRRGKNGVTVLTDMGSYYHHYSENGNQKLVEYERSLPKKFDGSLKGFCLYHQKDFERRFSQEHQASLLECHSTNIMLEDVSKHY